MNDILIVLLHSISTVFRLLKPKQSVIGRAGDGGGLVFAASQEGNLIALGARTSQPQWRFGAGGFIPSSPMSWSLDGKPYVTASSATVLYTFALP